MSDGEAGAGQLKGFSATPAPASPSALLGVTYIPGPALQAPSAGRTGALHLFLTYVFHPTPSFISSTPLTTLWGNSWCPPLKAEITEGRSPPQD